MVNKPKGTVLIVEDSEEIKLQMNTMLRGKGHDVLFASNAEEAVRVAEDQRPGMILTDLDLPSLGLLVEMLRVHEDLKNMPLAVIDIDGPETKEKGLKVLANFSQLDELLQTIQ